MTAHVRTVPGGRGALGCAPSLSAYQRLAEPLLRVVKSVIYLGDEITPLAVAREEVRTRLDHVRSPTEIEQAVFFASEMITAAVCHNMTDITLVIDLRDRGTHIEVQDCNARPLIVDHCLLEADIPR